jgi:hypothetical protein
MGYTDVALGALQGGLGAYSAQLEVGMQRAALEASEIRRTENLNRLSRDNKYLLSDSGYQTNEGRPLTVEQAEGYDGAKVNSYDANRKRAIDEQRVAREEELKFKSSTPYTNFEDEMAAKEAERTVKSYEALTAAGYTSKGKLITDINKAATAKAQKLARKELMKTQEGIYKDVQKDFPIPEGATKREINSVMSARKKMSWRLGIQRGVFSPLTTNQAEEYYLKNGVHHVSVGPKLAKDIEEANKPKPAKKPKSKSKATGDNRPKDYRVGPDGVGKFYYRGTEEEAEAPAPSGFNVEDIPIAGRVIKDFRRQALRGN